MQTYFFILFVGLDSFFLILIAYNWFLAICHPLHYMVIVNLQFCGLLVLVTWNISVLHSMLHSLMALRMPFCRDLKIPHLLCELNQVVQLACSDIILNDMVMYFATVLLGGVSQAGVLCSDSKIIFSICGISSAQGKYRTFSACASRLSVVSPFYYTCLGVYLSSAAIHSSQSSATASVM
nr:olfactory receptor 7A10-like [Equus asinus]